jgi:uncharacterized protein YbbC (DUF1343 family)
MNKVLTGLEIFRDEYWHHLKGQKLGLLSNHASLDHQLTSAKKIVIQRLPGQLKVLFGPQHGYKGEDQDNMVETDHMIDQDLGIPIFSLYAKNREPLPEMLDLIDTLIIDLQDVGTRVYTFASTMLNSLQAVAKQGKRIVVLDRPNPLGGAQVEGNLLSTDLLSFVGPFKYPMRHGLTMAEMARIFNDQYQLGVELEIVPLKGWRRRMLWFDTGLKWLMPSPNMPLPETAYVYPGQVIWEGTNLSEGRGTCRPFEIFGAPYLDTKKVRDYLTPEAMEGCHLQEISFKPTFHKWTGELCNGFMIHIIDPHRYSPYFTSLALLKTIIEVHRERFQWKSPPYEYEYEKMPIDIILGNSELRQDIESGKDLLKIKAAWLSEINEYLEWRRPYLLYK